MMGQAGKQKPPGFGFTTGSCAAAAAKAAAHMLLLGRGIEEISLITPAGVEFCAPVHCLERRENSVSAGIYKDAGEDPDITHGAMICAKVCLAERRDGPAIRLEGGDGVGRVTRPGLDPPVGSAAINSRPRAMIVAEVEQVCRALDWQGGLDVEIFVPRGEELAKSTFNSRLGIVGGISILGTSGLVEPMSRQALLDTIALELEQRRALGRDVVAMAPGNYGREFLLRAYGYDVDASVKCSNFIGLSLDMAREKGFTSLLLTGHMGKLVKVAAGVMNTHSQEGDGRMEILAAAALRCGADGDMGRALLDCISTEAAVEVLEAGGLKTAVMGHLTERIYQALQRRGGSMAVECMVYSQSQGLLGSSPGAEALLARIQGR